MDYLRAKKDQAIERLEEELAGYNINIEETEPSQPKILLSPLSNEIELNYPRPHESHCKGLAIDKIPEDFKIIKRVNDALICLDGIREDKLKRPVPGDFSKEGDLESPKMAEKKKLAEEIFKYPLAIESSKILREIPHYQMIEKEINRKWVEEYAEREVYNIKGRYINNFNNLGSEHKRYITSRTELQVARDIARAEPYGMELPEGYRKMASYDMVSGVDLYENGKEMNTETFEDLTDVVNRWIMELGLESEFKWVNTNRIL